MLSIRLINSLRFLASSRESKTPLTLIPRIDVIKLLSRWYDDSRSWLLVDLKNPYCSLISLGLKRYELFSLTESTKSFESLCLAKIPSNSVVISLLNLVINLLNIYASLLIKTSSGLKNDKRT